MGDRTTLVGAERTVTTVLAEARVSTVDELRRITVDADPRSVAAVRDGTLYVVEAD